MEQVTDLMLSLHRQINSLTAITLQNKHALELFIAEKCGTCIFLGEECRYYVNQSGVIITRSENQKARSIREWKTSEKFGIESQANGHHGSPPAKLTITLLVTIGHIPEHPKMRFIETIVTKRATL